MKERLEITTKKIDQKQDFVKSLIRDKKKAEAKRHLISLKQLQDEVSKQENMCIMLEKTKLQLETANDTSKVVQVFKDAASMQKDVEKNREYLEDFLVDKKEYQENNTEIARILDEIAIGDPNEMEEIDQMYADMERNALEGEIQRVNSVPLTNVEPGKPRVNTVTQSSKQVEDSSIDQLLAEASDYA